VFALLQESADVKKKNILEKRIRRSAAAAMLGVTPATLRRYELKGLLPAIRLNSRLTIYKESDVLKLANGQ
jgi:predicted site-specific integrase-resolvase